MTTVIETSSQTPTQKGIGEPTIKTLNGPDVPRSAVINIRREPTRLVIMTLRGSYEVEPKTFAFLELIFGT